MTADLDLDLDLEPADWALVVEALVTWAGNPNDIDGPWADRAYAIVELIAADQCCRPSDLVAGRHHR